MSENEQVEEAMDYNAFNRQLIEEFRANGGKSAACSPVRRSCS